VPFCRRTMWALAGWVLAGVLAIAVATGVASAGAESVIGLAASTAPAPPADGDAGASTPADDGEDRAKRARPWLWRHLEHGELVVRRQQGHQDVLIQRGEVTSVSGHSLTVRSPDGFTATWTLSNDTRIRKAGEAARADQLTKGVDVVVAGPGEGSTGDARFVRLHR
jgi:hypothetical protein